MKIGIVLSAPPAYSEIFFRNKIKLLRELGHDVIIFTPKGVYSKNMIHDKNTKSLKIISRLTYTILLFFAVFYIQKILTLVIANKKTNFSLKKNIISLFKSMPIIPYKLDWLYFGYAEVAIGRENLASVIGAKLAVSIRGYDLSVYPLSRPSCYALLWKRIDKLHYLSDNLLSLAQKSGFDKKNVPSIKIPPAIDCNAYTKYHKLYKGKISCMREPIIFTSISRLHWVKGLDDTIIALSYLDKINFCYNIIGDGAERQRLLFLINDLGLNNKVNLLGKLTHEETSKVLNKSDIYLQYSEHEGFCNSVLEAQSVGLICIVSDGGGLNENVIDEETGFIVPRRRPELLAMKINEVINLNSQIIGTISTNARSRVIRDFNLNVQMKSFENFYNN